jgi:hypothetical protein
MNRILHHVRRQAVGYLALFVALSGSAYAAVNLPNRSVTGKKIARNTITKTNLKKNSVTARAIARNAVRGSEVLESSLGTVPRAARLGGASLAQVRSGIDAARLGGAPRSAFYSAAEVESRLSRAVTEDSGGGEVNFSSQSPVDRVSLNLRAPRAGYAHVVANGNLHPNGTIDAGHRCTVQASVNEIAQSPWLATFEAGDTQQHYESLSGSWVVAVPAGTSTFTLRFSVNPNVSTMCTDGIFSASATLSAVWVPNAG